uniref:Membrane protein BRI3 n=1 Tax=Glossina austeni TaxID=7395 RepID=A0A1A9V4F4_GLOAU
MSETKNDVNLPSYEEAMQAPLEPPSMGKFSIINTNINIFIINDIFLFILLFKALKYPNSHESTQQAPNPYINLGPQPSLAQQQHYANATAPNTFSHTGCYGQVPSYGAFESTPVSVVISQPLTVPPEIIIIGGCPACRIGILEDSFPLLALCCAIAFFPSLHDGQATKAFKIIIVTNFYTTV